MSDKMLQRHVFCNNLHIPHDRRIEHFCIVPRHIDIGMSEHLGNIVNRGTAGQCQGGERMAGAM